MTRIVKGKNDKTQRQPYKGAIPLHLYVLIDYDDTILKVFKDDREAEAYFQELFGYKPNGNYSIVSRIEELDGYQIHLTEKK